MNAATLVPSAPLLVCAALPHGYGPAAKLVALAQEMGPGVNLAFVGSGVAWELATRASGLWQAQHSGSPQDPVVTDWLKEAAGVLSIMDREAGFAAARAGCPLYVLDSLLWMRPRVPPGLEGASVLWAQAFPGLEPERYQPTPVVVGPVLGPSPPPTASRRGLVVHLGGSDAPGAQGGFHERYACSVARALIDAGLPSRLGPVTVLGGTAAMAAVLNEVQGAPIGVRSVGSDEARACMAAAAAVLTCPGLTATLACLSDGTPTWFLPPQNYSQAQVLRVLRSHGLGQASLHWDELPGVPFVEGGQEPEAVASAVQEARQRALAAWGQGVLADRLTAVGQHPQEQVSKGSELLHLIGPEGRTTIARGLRQALGLPDRAPRRGGAML